MFLEEQGIEPLIPPDRQDHGSRAEPVAALPPEELAALPAEERQRHRVSTGEGRARYARRKTIVEPTYGQIKGSPAAPGFRGFLRRGLLNGCQEGHWIGAVQSRISSPSRRNSGVPSCWSGWTGGGAIGRGRIEGVDG
jgi:hypothetical protein